MKKRSKLPKKQSKKLFTRTAKSVHPKNTKGPSRTSGPMRGGIRL
nr:MAG: hypothetical protein [Microvirus sp.]